MDEIDPPITKHLKSYTREVSFCLLDYYSNLYCILNQITGARATSFKTDLL